MLQVCLKILRPPIGDIGRDEEIRKIVKVSHCTSVLSLAILITLSAFQATKKGNEDLEGFETPEHRQVHRFLRRR